MPLSKSIEDVVDIGQSDAHKINGGTGLDYYFPGLGGFILAAVT